MTHQEALIRIQEICYAFRWDEIHQDYVTGKVVIDPDQCARISQICELALVEQKNENKSTNR